MPNILIKIPKGAFDAVGRAKLGQGVHAAAKAVEGWGDAPRQEALTWVLVEEVPTGNLFVGGLAGQVLVRLELGGEKVVKEERLLRSLGERIRDVRQGPDGAIWLLIDDSSGRLLRLVPAR